MVNFSWLIPNRAPDFLPEIAFKRTSEGWVFKTPNRWLFGSPKYYLLDEARKNEIDAVLYHPSGCSLLWRIPVAVLVVSVPFLVFFVTRSAFTTQLILVGALVIAVLVGNLDVYRRLQPLLAGAPLTTRRISLTDQLAFDFNTAARRMPVTVMVFLVLLFAPIAVVRAFDAITMDHRLILDSIFQMIVAAFWGLGAIYSMALLIARLRMRRAGALRG